MINEYGIETIESEIDRIERIINEKDPLCEDLIDLIHKHNLLTEFLDKAIR